MRQALFLLLFFSNSLLAQVNLNQGLVAYYPFNGNANDQSGNNNNPIFNNATLTADRFGNPNSAYSFNGVDNYIQIPNNSSLNPTNQISLCAWVKVSGFYQGPCHGNSILMKGDADYLPGNYHLRFDDNGYTNGQNCINSTVDINHENFYAINTSLPAGGYSPFIQTGQWYSVVYTYDGTTAKLYVNCELVLTNPVGGVNFSNSYDLFLGRLNDSQFPYWFNGVMDEVRIYNRALNQDEVNAYGDCNLSTCNNWLYLPSQPSYIDVGDLDVSGNQITVEALLNSTLDDNGFGDIVSKHSTFTDVNYLLRAYSGEITTTTGYYKALANCSIYPNKTYHVAMVYDGASLKFYRNGFLLAQVAATGNLILNDWHTWIGYFQPQSLNENFIGYINEVRIWNVARTQQDIQTYMNSSLPNPTTQTGLLAYYTFNDLTNKQGNSAWNGTIGGSATVQATNPSCNFTADSCLVQNSSCNNWLSLPSQPSYVNVGDLDIPGDQITVEAMINRTTPYVGGSLYAGDVVSKHDNPGDVNYLLRPNSAEITTTNGYFKTPDICEIELNKTYHVAMVYDGNTLKFYRNGFLMSQIAATGDLFQNDWQTRIGYYQNQMYNTNFIGYINEVRIWNVARTQGEIQTYMNTSLPSPTTQPGLLAYYIFNDLANKQGNTVWNGTLGGSATFSSTNPNCNFIADSCDIIPVTPTDTIINSYTPVTAFNPCDNKITVEDASAFNTGDTVLIIQMKGAVIDSSNTSNFGNITDYKNAGNYEFNYVKTRAGNIIELENALTKQYDIPDGKVQLIRVPYYQSININSTLTCLPWDGNKGGVVVLNARDTITLNADIDVSAKGFHGATGYNSQTGTLNCFQNEYNYPISSNGSAAQKGESITTISDNIICGKGSPAGGGGGGLGHNSGGGGGANGGLGGFGGYQLEPCGNAPYDNRGISGHALIYNSSSNKIFMGSGGGAGHEDNIGNIPTGGGNGGGIIIITSNFLKSNTHQIQSNGDNGIPCKIPPSVDCHDGMGGGGAGGTILLNVSQLLDNTITENKGGNGADMIGSVPLGGRIGGGGGGGGGLLFLKNNSLPASLTNVNSGGVNGVLTTDNNNPWGATPGQTGIALFNLQIPIDSILFKPNIDSVKIKDSTIGCNSFNFQNLWFTNITPITQWQWDFGDGGISNAQIVNHTYNLSSGGTYTIKVIVSDINGCKDSSSILLTTPDPPIVKTNNDTAFCPGIQMQLSTTGGLNYSWSPSAGLSNSNISNPIANPNSSIQYIVTGTTLEGCVGKDTINVTVYSKPFITKSNDTAICKNSSIHLFASGGILYNWSPPVSLNNNSISDPVATPTTNTTYFITVTDSNTCINTDSINISIRPDPLFTISNPTSLCTNNTVQLNASGGNIYSWQPSVSLNNSSISNPMASPQATTNYSVQITDTVCNTTSTLSTTVIVLVLPSLVAAKSNDLDCSNDHSNLAATGAVSYLWSPANSLDNPNISNPIATPTTQTLYIVKGTDANGCVNYDSVMVNITGQNKSGYLMPTAFTPNNDGKNDCYGIKYWGVIEELDFGIYNRWGERIFHTNNPNDCWDGTYKGVKQDPGVFVYLITAKTLCGKVFRKGTFVLIR